MLTNRQLFLQNLAQTSDAPLQIEIEKAEGIYLYGPDMEEIAVSDNTTSGGNESINL